MSNRSKAGNCCRYNGYCGCGGIEGPLGYITRHLGVSKTTTAEILSGKVWVMGSPSKSSQDQSSHRGTAETNSTRNNEVAGLIPGLAQWVKDLALLGAVV